MNKYLPGITEKHWGRSNVINIDNVKFGNVGNLFFIHSRERERDDRQLDLLILEIQKTKLVRKNDLSK